MVSLFCVLMLLCISPNFAEVIYQSDFATDLAGWTRTGITKRYTRNFFALQLKQTSTATQVVDVSGSTGVLVEVVMAAYSLEGTEQCTASLVEDSNSAREILTLVNGEENRFTTATSSVATGTQSLSIVISSQGDQKNDRCRVTSVTVTGSPITAPPSPSSDWYEIAFALPARVTDLEIDSQLAFVNGGLALVYNLPGGADITSPPLTFGATYVQVNYVAATGTTTVWFDWNRDGVLQSASELQSTTSANLANMGFTFAHLATTVSCAGVDITYEDLTVNDVVVGNFDFPAGEVYNPYSVSLLRNTAGSELDVQFSYTITFQAGGTYNPLGCAFGASLELGTVTTDAPTSAPTPAPASTILVLGDSYGSFSKGLPGYFCQGFSSINRAVGGSTAAQWAADTNSILTNALSGLDLTEISHVWLSVGGNDFLGTLCPSDANALSLINGDIQTAVGNVQSALPNVPIMLTSYCEFVQPMICPLSVFHSIDNIIAPAGAIEGVTFVDLAGQCGGDFANNVFSSADLMVDLIHPSSKGFCGILQQTEVQSFFGCTAAPVVSCDDTIPTDVLSGNEGPQLRP